MKIIAYEHGATNPNRYEVYFSDTADTKSYEDYMIKDHIVSKRKDIIRETREGEPPAFVWIVEGSDRYYDSGEEWTVGVYSSFEKAQTAQMANEAGYSGSNPDDLSYSIYQLLIDK